MKYTYEYAKARFWPSRSEEGATAVEYGIMVALIAVVIIVVVALLGENLREVFGFVASTLENVT